jgi:hypothetical protein
LSGLVIAGIARVFPSWKGVDADIVSMPELLTLHEGLFGPLDPVSKRRLLEQAAQRERAATTHPTRLAA